MIRIQACEQEYHATDQDVQALEFAERLKLLPQDVHVFHAHAERSATRENSLLTIILLSSHYVTSLFRCLSLAKYRR